MKIDQETKIEGQVPSQTGAFGFEDKEARESRMRAWWNQPENEELTKVGKLLSWKFGGKSGAEWLLDGESLEFSDKLNLPNGGSLTLAPGQVISLKTLGIWGCPACKSAHGTGEGASPRTKLSGLQANEFYLSKSGKLFTFSSTCWGRWVKALGMASRVKALGSPVKASPVKGGKK